MRDVLEHDGAAVGLALAEAVPVVEHPHARRARSGRAATTSLPSAFSARDDQAVASRWRPSRSSCCRAAGSARRPVDQGGAGVERVEGVAPEPAARRRSRAAAAATARACRTGAASPASGDGSRTRGPASCRPRTCRRTTASTSDHEAPAPPSSPGTLSASRPLSRSRARSRERGATGRVALRRRGGQRLDQTIYRCHRCDRRDCCCFTRHDRPERQHDPCPPARSASAALRSGRGRSPLLPWQHPIRNRCLAASRSPVGAAGCAGRHRRARGLQRACGDEPVLVSPHPRRRPLPGHGPGRPPGVAAVPATDRPGGGAARVRRRAAADRALV